MLQRPIISSFHHLKNNPNLFDYAIQTTNFTQREVAKKKFVRQVEKLHAEWTIKLTTLFELLRSIVDTIVDAISSIFQRPDRIEKPCIGNHRDLWRDINLVNYRGHRANCIDVPSSRPAIDPLSVSPSLAKRWCRIYGSNFRGER